MPHALVNLTATFLVACVLIRNISADIVMKQTLLEGDDCVDYLGDVKGHLDSWSSSANSCDKLICFHGKREKFYIRHECRQIGPLDSPESPENPNCYHAADTNLAYPDCCPYLACDGRPVVSTTPIPSCYDRSVNTSCMIWKLFGGCELTNAYYRFTRDYCQQTCGFC